MTQLETDLRAMLISENNLRRQLKEKNAEIARLRAENEARDDHFMNATLRANIAILADENDALRAKLAAVEADGERLHKAMLRDWPECILVDDDGFYESLLKTAGLIEPRVVVEPCGANECCCEPGDTCNFLTEKGKAARQQEDAKS